MNIILSALDDDLYRAWEQACGDLPFVRLHKGSILTLQCHAVVSPANSFGFMDGGIDRSYARFFGLHLQKTLQGEILRIFHGELPVGNAIIVPTNSPSIPFLIASPTMRVPMILGKETVNPYLAARAVLIAIEKWNDRESEENRIHSVAFPGLATGVGRVPVNICARQVRTAIDTILLQKQPFPHSWSEAQRNHQLLYANETRDLQFGEEDFE